MPVPLWQPLPGLGVQEGLVTKGAWQEKGAEKGAMPAAMWDEEDSGDEETAVRGYYEKPLGWERVLLNVLFSWLMSPCCTQTSHKEIEGKHNPLPKQPQGK